MGVTDVMTNRRRVKIGGRLAVGGVAIGTAALLIVVVVLIAAWVEGGVQPVETVELPISNPTDGIIPAPHGNGQ